MTLIEIIVVMAIITIIASAIVAASMGVFAGYQVRSTKNFMNQLAVALDKYHGIHRMYVPARQGLDPNPADQSTIELWQALEHGSEAKFSVEARFKEKGDPGVDPATNQLFDRYYYLDAWAQPLYYECNPPFRSFELRSVGKDQGMNTDDDVVRQNE